MFQLHSFPFRKKIVWETLWKGPTTCWWASASGWILWNERKGHI